MRLQIAQVVAFLLATTGCFSAPRGELVHDPDLLALLRPSAPVRGEQLRKTKAGKIYYVATLTEAAPVNFLADYERLLAERGLTIVPGGSSPHAPVQKITDYTVRIVQEASVQPYTIRYKVSVDLAPDATIGDYEHPLNLVGRQLSVRLHGTVLGSWQTALVVPDRDMVTRPFAIPVPEGLYLREVAEEGGGGLVRGSPSEETTALPRIVRLYLIGELPPEAVFDFYSATLSKAFTPRFRGDTRLVMVPSGPQPAWAPRPLEAIAVTYESALFSKDGVGVRDASFVKAERRNQYVPLYRQQPRSLKHLPPEARHYWVSVHFLREATR